MAKSFHQVYVHLVFNTKNRTQSIKPEFEKRLWAYIGGTGRKKGFPVIACGGTSDHLHLLVSLSSSVCIAKTVQILKATSSKWINDNFYKKREFKWQSGYAAFSLGQSGLKRAVRYIQNQQKHHEAKSFKEEYIQLLDKYGIEYDKKYVWG